MRTTYTSDKILNLYRGTTFTAPRQCTQDS
jgi:hypothetical protein